MEFQSQGRPLTEQGMDSVCQLLGVNDAEVWAVLTVETRGFGFLRDRRPQILFERHVFHRQTGGTHDAGHENISNVKPGGYSGGTAEYARLESAMALDRSAAQQSASWGVGQVMGFNHGVAGFATVEAMVAAMVEDEDAQLLAMARFINRAGLAQAMRRKNWTSFARGYNGSDFKRNEYDTRLAAAHAKFQTILPDLGLRAAQAKLLYLGIDPGPIDGLRGRNTRSALIEYQGRKALPQSGDLDDETEAHLAAEVFPV